MTTRRLAFYDLRDWIVSDSRIRELLRVEQKGVIPFFPAADQPESSLPYIRYDIDRRIQVDKWWIHTEGVIFDIFTEDVEDSNEIFNIIIDYSSQGDDSARSLERWIEEQGRQRTFEFHSIEYMTGGQLSAPDEQGGGSFKTGMILIHYSPLSGRLIST
jgi:hypothetical protein